MCHLSPSALAVQQAIPNSCTAKQLAPAQRRQLALEALAGSQSITALAKSSAVSRQFVYRQSALAHQALEQAFAPAADAVGTPADKVLFHLPVTKAWLEQLTLGLVLICRSSLRSAQELLAQVLDCKLSLGTVHQIVHKAVAPACRHNQAQDLGGVRQAAHDELFQAGQPVLVGVDAQSSYCYLLSRQAQRDQQTWALHLLELQARGFAPAFVIADAAAGLRAGHALALPAVACRSDLFHALKELTEVRTKLDNRAYQAMTDYERWAGKLERAQQHGQRLPRAWVKRRTDAALRQAQAIDLADAVALLGRWLRQDVLALAGPPLPQRQELYDFVCQQLHQRQGQAAALLGPLLRYLQQQRDGLLAFAGQLDRDLEQLATRLALPGTMVRALWNNRTGSLAPSRRWHQDAALRQQLGRRYFPLSQALKSLRRHSVRASSLVENLNGRLRGYFFWRRHLSQDYLNLLRFFLNHRRYGRSAHPERVGRSPAELLSGTPHAHWLELLGYKRFRRS